MTKTDVIRTNRMDFLNSQVQFPIRFPIMYHDNPIDMKAIFRKYNMDLIEMIPFAKSSKFQAKEMVLTKIEPAFPPSMYDGRL